MGWDKEMQKALEADGEKLRQMTGKDHGPRFAADPFIDPTKAGTVFEDHSCYRCDSGNKPCINGKGNERNCDTLHARND